jgi:hypothetical protein
MTNLPYRWAGLFVVLAFALGCAELEVEDRSVFFPTLRVSKRLDETWSLGVVGEYGAGSDTASGSVGTPIVVDGQSFSGPVDADFDLATVRLEARGRHDFSPTWFLEGFFGAVLYYVDVTVSDGTTSANEDKFEWSPHVGGRVGWRPAPRVQAYAELYMFRPIPDGIVLNGGSEVGLEYEAAGGVSVLGGWRFRNIDLILPSSNFELEWSGPFLGLAFDF